MFVACFLFFHNKYFLFFIRIFFSQMKINCIFYSVNIFFIFEVKSRPQVKFLRVVHLLGLCFCNPSCHSWGRSSRNSTHEHSPCSGQVVRKGTSKEMLTCRIPRKLLLLLQPFSNMTVKKTSTYANRWILDDSLAGACCIKCVQVTGGGKLESKHMGGRSSDEPDWLKKQVFPTLNGFVKSCSGSLGPHIWKKHARLGPWAPVYQVHFRCPFFFFVGTYMLQVANHLTHCAKQRVGLGCKFRILAQEEPLYCDEIMLHLKDFQKGLCLPSKIIPPSPTNVPLYNSTFTPIFQMQSYSIILRRNCNVAFFNPPVEGCTGCLCRRELDKFEKTGLAQVQCGYHFSGVFPKEKKTERWNPFIRLSSAGQVIFPHLGC
ncbi:hypothetical protein VP01_227g1 [Puccinia sorghi]|uniref:Uncharacterized protein n=1 Tax=Puccinia sorghi TaxID=27349 RepID=A0A0L6V8A6_9BASI|nr:hypothetical protein VP01_227g1 [Puccinia sorghi]